MNNYEYLKKYLKPECLEEGIKKLEQGIPPQYIVGNVDFYGNTIYVDENVLIPRFETELLIEKTIKKIKQYFPNKKIDILDIGTGSGCIAISLKKEINSNVDALDISSKAIEVAKKNALYNKTNINFINQDMTTYKEKKYDVIISNPPYISYDEDIMDIVKNNEPHPALYAEDNGLYYYKKIIDNLPLITNKHFLVAFEIGHLQGEYIINYAKSNLDNITITLEQDYSNKDRFIFITNI